MFDLKEYLAQRRSHVNARLDAVMPPASRLPATLHTAMRYAVLTDGKRLRPIVAMACAEALGTPALNVEIPALALEVLHTYTLVHDDLPCMDDDDLRRGRPTAHIQFGEANAVLAADALQALAFGLAGSVQPPPPAAPTAYVVELADASAAVVAGQVEDIAVVPGQLSEEQLSFIHLHKTAYLFRAAARFGALAAAATEQQLKSFTRFGTHLGIAFQLIDDLLDAAAPDFAPANDPSSSILVVGEPEVRRRAAEHTSRATNELRPLGNAAIPLIALSEHMLARTV